MIWFGIPIIISIYIGFFLFYRLPVCSSKKRPLTSLPKISVIIPARNEEKNLPGLLNSLKTQTILPDEIIVVDDNSVDGTARIAMEHGVQVLTSPKLPEGWLGKPWSCYQGASNAKGDAFIFLDADTFLENYGLEKMMCMFNDGRGAISIFPYHRVKKFHEAFSAIFNLMQLAGMHKFSFRNNLTPIGMFGPCLIISRKDYFKIDGHKAVCGEVLEHYVMADILRKHDISTRLFRGKGSLNVRMYPEGWNALIRGWSKSFNRGADQTPRLNMSLSVMWISGLIVSSIFFFFSFFSGTLIDIFFWSTVYLLCVFQIWIYFRRVGDFPLWSAVFYPANLIFFLTVFSFAAYRSSRNRQIEWKGRKIN